MLIRRTLGLSTLALAILSFAFAGVASARLLSMTGEWFMNRGPLIDIPTNGGQMPCGGGAPNGCIANLKPVLGGIAARTGGLVAVRGAGPAPSFTIPPQKFHQAFGKQVAAVPFVLAVVQLSSTWSLTGPPFTTAANTATLPLANIPGKFMKNAWQLDPGQAARLKKSFTWCPASRPQTPPNPTKTQPPFTCTNSKTSPPYIVMVKYKNVSGPAFGGTMAMMLNGNGVVSVIIPGSNLGHQLVGAGRPGNPQHPGRGYATFDTDALMGGPVHLGLPVTGPPCTNVLPALPPGCGQIISSGPVVGAMPLDTNLNWGFPWTTGTVTARNKDTVNTTTLTGMGSDSRTVNGVGKITLVAGGATHRVGPAQNYSGLDVIVMTFSNPPVPAVSAAGLVAVAVLILLAAGYALRRRL
jgi:hypothetical protein